MRLACAITFLTVILLTGPVLARSVGLVSQNVADSRIVFPPTRGDVAPGAQDSVRTLEADLGILTRISVASDGTEGTLDSYLPYPGLSISADGSLVTFSSSASELDSADVDGGFADIFLHDTIAGSTTLVTIGGVLNKNSYRCALSPDGGTTVYYHEDDNGLILQDLLTGARTTVVSLSSYLSNSGPGISRLGRRIIYEKNGQVWLFERAQATTTQVSVNSAGETANANCADIAISPDGSCVAFISSATNLDASNATGRSSLYLHLIDQGLTMFIPTSLSGQVPTNVIKPTLSETGRYVTFLADDGIVGDGIGTLYVKDLANGELRQFAVDAANPSISADGRFVCYSKEGANGSSQLYRADLAAVTESIHLVSNAGDLEGDGNSYRGVISSTGQFVAFASNAANLTPNDSNDKCDVFLNDFGMPANDLPSPSLTSIATDEDTPLQDIPLTFNDAEDNDVRTEIVNGPAQAAMFVVHNRQPGQKYPTFSYLPNANYHGEDSFTYRCGDAQGWSAPQTVVITIRPVDDLPHWIGMPALWGVCPGQEFRLDLSRCVADVDTQNPDSDLLYFSLLQDAPQARIEGTMLIISAEGTAGSQPIALRIGVTDRQDGPIVEFDQELAIYSREALEISLIAGWNLISFPMLTEPSSTALLQVTTRTPDAECRPLGPVWSCDRAAAVYHPVTTIEPGRAYWVFCPEAASITLQVAWEAPVNPTLAMVTGWNPVGPVGWGEVAIPAWGVTDSPIASENIWSWEGAQWKSPKINVLECGRGYLLHSCSVQTANLQLGAAEE